MSEKISADIFSDAVQTVLLSFVEDTTEMVRQTAESVGKETVQILRDSSPKDSGTYASGWRLKRATSGRDAIRITVYNKDHYQRTHLLENGHVKVNGGRTTAYPHIKPAEEHAAKKFEEQIRLEVGKNK